MITVHRSPLACFRCGRDIDQGSPMTYRTGPEGWEFFHGECAGAAEDSETST
jgi:hypothetical protein